MADEKQRQENILGVANSKLQQTRRVFHVEYAFQNKLSLLPVSTRVSKTAELGQRVSSSGNSLQLSKFPTKRKVNQQDMGFMKRLFRIQSKRMVEESSPSGYIGVL
jgi:hypothetical protein